MKRVKKPDWLKIRLGNNEQFSFTGKTITDHHLHTICQSGKCPNLGECWNKGTATFMIGGEICTRSCKFCNTKTGRPLPLDPKEPHNIAESIAKMDLKHVVITSVDRDDLPDFGATHWKQTIQAVKLRNPGITMEVLIPDFQGNNSFLDFIIEARPDIISHNMETVRRLTPLIRHRTGYKTGMEVLKYLSKSGIPIKSGIMVGLGEKKEEVWELMDDLLTINCRLLSIGQYLQPSKKNIPVLEYISPEMFNEYKQTAITKGFKHIESAPLVRSSYHSKNFLKNISDFTEQKISF